MVDSPSKPLQDQTSRNRSTIRPHEARAGDQTADDSDFGPYGEKPTLQVAAEFQFAYEQIRERLFGGKLPECLITISNSPSVFGQFIPSSYCNASDDWIDCITLNTTFFPLFGIREALSTLTHECVHMKQWHDSNAKKRKRLRAYHDKEFAEIMEAAGLITSVTGKPGGARTGRSMMEYEIPGGPFSLLADELLENGFTFTWAYLHGIRIVRNPAQDTGTETARPRPIPQKPKRKRERIKHTCSNCGISVWGPRRAEVACLTCNPVLRTPIIPMIKANHDD